MVLSEDEPHHVRSSPHSKVFVVVSMIAERFVACLEVSTGARRRRVECLHDVFSTIHPTRISRLIHPHMSRTMARHVNGSSVPPERVSPSPKDDTTSAVVHVQAQDEDRIRIKNRRKRYLDLHPEYTRGSNLELAGRHIHITLISLSYISRSPANLPPQQIHYSMTDSSAASNPPPSANAKAANAATPGVWKQISCAWKPSSKPFGIRI